MSRGGFSANLNLHVHIRNAHERRHGSLDSFLFLVNNSNAFSMFE